MMIKINLLPVRQVKKREVGKQILVLYALLVVGALIGNWYWWDARDSALQSARNETAAVNQKIQELERIIGEVNNINKRQAELKEKLNVLAELKKGRAGPVKILDALARATPKKVWVKEFDEKSGAVNISGTAFSHEDVAEFMRGLTNLVWTPKGMGRLVEKKREATTSRVELMDQGGAIEEFNVAEVGSFFTAVELKSAKQVDVKTELGEQKQVEFQLNLAAHYTL